MSRVKNWIELLTLVGVFIGLALVILQLRQNEELIRFQIATEIRVNQDNNRNAIKGEQFSRTLANIQSSPESLTDEELLQFQAHARSLLNELTFRRILAEAGIFKGDWTTWLKSETCELLDNSVGRTWLKTQSQAIDEEMLTELDRRLTECGGRPSFIEAVRRDESS
jgi:hypothetical protein